MERLFCHYHANNGRFAESLWLNTLKNHQPQQTILFCGVETHHQNRIVEKKICDLQQNARMMMLHLAIQWLVAHSVSLWPYDIKTAADVMKATLRGNKIAVSLIKRFSGVKIRHQLKIFHVFGHPIIILSAALQTQQAQSK
jgi:hypothetical protein